MQCIFCRLRDNDFNLTLRKCRLKKNRQRKGLQKQKGRCYLLLSLRQRLENLSCLFPSSCFLFYFVLSALNSSPPPLSLFPIMLFLTLPLLIFPHLSFSLPYIFLSSLCTLLPHYPFTACHSVTLLRPLYSQLISLSLPLSLPLQFLHSPSFPLSRSPSAALSVRLRLRSQLTFATRRCSCARTEEHATRIRSASVLQSLRGYCANTPAARRERTATPPLPCTSPRPPCCSALC